MITKLGPVWLICCVVEAAKLKDENPFLTAINSPFYVDKTGFIEYFHNKFNYPIYFTAPLSFGKTTNLLMLKAFYEINTSKNGTILQNRETENYKNFQRVKNITTARVTRTLMDEDKFFDSNFGSQPVIHLSFKSIHIDRIDIVINSLRLLMINAFKNHSYLNVSEKLTSEERTLFGKFVGSEVNGEQLIESSGGTLAKLLNKHFEKPCLLLIDDFDEPIIKIFTNGSADEEHIMKIMRNFVNYILSDKKTVNRAFLTGKTRLAGIYAPHSVKHYQFGLHEGITKFFGVTDAELPGIANNSTVLYQLLARLRVIYKGFTMANSACSLYDPGTITELLEGRNLSRALDPVEFLAPALGSREVKDKLELAIRAFREDTFSITAPRETDHEKCVFTMRKIFQPNSTESTLDESDRQCLFYYLFELGYFAVSAQEGPTLTLDLPDVAAYYSLSSQLERFWLGRLHTTDVIAEVFVEAFMSLNWKESSLDTFADSVMLVFNESLQPPTAREDLRSPLFTFLATRVQNYPVLKVRCGDDLGSSHTDFYAETQREGHSRKDVALEFVLRNCTRENFDEHIRTRCWLEFLKTVKNDKLYREALRFLVIEICLNDNEDFEFAFTYVSKKHTKEYYLIRKMNRWEPKEETAIIQEETSEKEH